MICLRMTRNLASRRLNDNNVFLVTNHYYCCYYYKSYYYKKKKKKKPHPACQGSSPKPATHDILCLSDELFSFCLKLRS